MDKQLINSLNRLSSLFTETQYGVALVQVLESQPINDFRILALNAIFQQMLEIPASRLIDQPLSQITSLPHKKLLLDALQKAHAQKQSCHFELHRFTPPENRSNWYELTVIPVEDNLLITSKQITELKDQRTLVLQAQLLQQAFSACPDGVTVFEAITDAKNEVTDFRFSMINDAGLAMNGLKRDEVVGKTLREFYPPTDSFGLFATYKQVYQTGQSYSGEHFYPDYSAWREVTVVRIANGLMVTYRDIAYRKQAEQAEKQQDLFKQALFANSPGALILLDPVFNPQQHLVDFRLVQGNPMAVAILGKDVDQLPGQLLSDFVAIDLITKTFLYGQQVLETSRAQQFLASCLINDKPCVFDCTLFKVGQCLCLNCIDTTQTVFNRQEIARLTWDLQRTSHNLQEFVYIASHDLQEPLRKIQAFGEILKDHYAQLPGDGADYLKRMQLSAQRMSALITALLEFSRLSTQPQTFSLVSLSAVLSEVLQTLDEEIKTKGAIIQIDTLPSVKGNSSQLTQLFEQLFSNSLKFVHPHQQPQILISCKKLKGEELPPDIFVPNQTLTFYRIALTDQGIGFDEKYADRIFGIFQRLHPRANYPGTGIGLAICKRIVENHNGLLKVHSKPNHGATFEIYLPAY